MTTTLITLKNMDGSERGEVSATLVGNFGVHRAEDGTRWTVTHLMSGLMAVGPDGPFRRHRDAISYAGNLDASEVDWFFTTVDEMHAKNDGTLLQGVIWAARVGLD